MAVSLDPKSCSNIPASFLYPKHKYPFKLISSNPRRTFAQLSEEKEGGGGKEEDPPAATFSVSLSSARTQLDLLEQLSSSNPAVDGPGYESDGGSGKLKIHEQLASMFGDRNDDFTVPLGRNLKKFTPKVLTISQKRNIRRRIFG